MVNKEQQIKNSLIYLVPKVLTGFLPILTLPFFTRVLTSRDYGVYAMAEIYAIICSGIVNFGLAASYERNFFQYKERKKSAQLLYSTLFFVLIVFMAAVVFTHLFSRPLARVFTGSTKFSGLLFWVFCATVIVSFKQYYLIYFKNSENAKDFVLYTFDETVLGVVLSFYFVLFLKVGVIGLAWGQCIASIVVLIFLMARFLKVLPVSFNWFILRESLVISLPLTPRIFMGVVSTQLNKYVLNLLNSLNGVGVFSIGQKIANVTFIFMTTLQNVFNPQIYKKMFDQEASGGKEIGRYLTPFVYFSVLACLGVSLFAEEAIHILTTPSFYSATAVVSIFSVYYAFQFFGKVNGAQLIYRKKTLVTSLLTMMDIIFGVSVSIPLIRKFGVIGAAWGALLGSLITGSISFFVSQHFYRIHWEVKKIILIFGVFCAATAVTLLTAGRSWDYGIRLALKMIFILGYCFVGFKLEILSRQNLMIVKKLVMVKRKEAVVGIDTLEG